MPDAKSLLPGRAFRSEHAQLRPEPHSIASHGPAPMDPLQTTRMRNGVLYAAEWPCCHDPLRLSLGSEDPFYIHNPRVRRARLRTPHPGGRARRARRVRAPPPRAGRRAPNANPPLLPPSNPSHRARAPPRARGSLPSVQVCPSSRTSRRPILISLPLKCVLASIRPLPDPTLASCPSRPRTPFVIPACQQPAHRVRAPAPRPRTPPAHTHAHRSPAP